MATNPNLLNTRLRDFTVSVNNQVRQEERDFGDVILGSFQAHEVLALISGNTEVINNLHPEIRQDMNAFIEKSGGMDKTEEKFVQSTLALFMDGLRNNENVFDGFEPETVTKEIAHKHFPGVIQCIQRTDYDQTNTFSQVDSL